VLAVVVVSAFVVCCGGGALSFEVRYDEHQPLSKVMLHNARVLLDDSVSISASPALLGQKVNPHSPQKSESVSFFKFLLGVLFVLRRHWNRRWEISDNIVFDDHGRGRQRIP
jgi:hypothetical protein